MQYKANTTRILVTHALSYMKYMDYIYLMDQGRIIEEGQYQQIKKSEAFTKIYEKYTKEFLQNQSDFDLGDK